MTGRSDNPNAYRASRALPDEAAMLAFVEGEATPAEEAVLRRGLAHAPQILASLEAMRRDKALLRASMLREALVPRSLSARVDEAIAREAVLGSSAGLGGFQDDGDAIVRPMRTQVVGGSWRRARVGLAMAAGLALAAGGAMLALNRTSGGGAGSGHNLAMNRGQSQGAGSGQAERGEPRGARGGEGEARLADATGVASTESPAVMPGSPSVAEPSVTIAASGGEGDENTLERQLASVPFDGTLFDLSTDLTGEVPEPELASTRLLPGTVARRDLMALAEQHRLALRVSADEPREVIEALEAAVAAAVAGDGSQSPVGWRVVRESPVMLASAIGVTLSPGSVMDESMSGGAATPGEDGTGPQTQPPERIAGDIDDAWLLRGTQDAMTVYLTEVDITPEALAELDRDLTRRGGSRTGFAALENPIDRVLDRNLLLVPADDVIWWYHPPRDWSRRTLVPVVVEKR